MVLAIVLAGCSMPGAGGPEGAWVAGSWSSGSVYLVNDWAVYGNLAYESLSSGNIGYVPASSPAWWVQRNP